MKLTLTTLTFTLIVFAGCASIQENYKPLYQAMPEKQEIQKK
ncbi:hypothetical protein [Sulfurimonas sp.]|nr:hypothetical protein [Sulfurimonas sp.]